MSMQCEYTGHFEGGIQRVSGFLFFIHFQFLTLVHTKTRRRPWSILNTTSSKSLCEVCALSVLAHNNLTLFP